MRIEKLQTSLWLIIWALIVPMISHAHVCESLFETPTSATVTRKDSAPVAEFNTASFHSATLAFAAQTPEQITAFRPTSVEEKMAWLEALSRLHVGEGIGSSLWPSDAASQARMLKLIRGDVTELSYRKLQKIANLGYLDRHLYFQMVKSFARLEFRPAETTYLTQRLESEFRTQGLLQGMQSAGLIDLKSGSNAWRERWRNLKPRVQFALESALSVSLAHLLIVEGRFSGGTVPVLRFVQSKRLPQVLLDSIIDRGIESNLPAIREHYGLKLPAETVNWALARTFQYVSMAVAVALIGDQLLIVAGTDPEDWVAEILGDRHKLELAALDHLETDADQMDLKIDRDAALADLRRKSIRDLKALIGRPN